MRLAARRDPPRPRNDNALTLDDIRAAARRLEGRVARTPLRPSSWLSDSTGADVRLKLETLQDTGSYKIRGALNTVLRLLEEQGARTPSLVTASAGNHGRALATAVRGSGIPLTVYAPAHAPRAKLDAIAGSGVTLVPCRDYDDAERRAKEHGARGAGQYISPYSHPDVIAGAGTVGLEIVEDWPEVDVVVVPIGGGGLVSGIAVAVRGSSESAQIAGVEVEASSPFTKSLEAGRIVEIDVRPTLADGLAGNLDPDTVTFEIVRHTVARIAIVGESDLRAAMAGIVRNEGVVAEGAAAVGVAALLAGKIDAPGRRVAVVISGGNVDPATLAGITDAARY